MRIILHYIIYYVKRNFLLSSRALDALTYQCTLCWCCVGLQDALCLWTLWTITCICLKRVPYRSCNDFTHIHTYTPHSELGTRAPTCRQHILHLRGATLHRSYRRKSTLVQLNKSVVLGIAYIPRITCMFVWHRVFIEQLFSDENK